MLTKNYVTFYGVGSFVCETKSKEIDSWDTDTAIEMAKDISMRYGVSPFGFMFSMRGREDDELDSKVINVSPKYYFRGQVKTLNQIQAENNPKNDILISNMECNHWDKVVYVDGHNFHVEEDDVVLATVKA